MKNKDMLVKLYKNYNLTPEDIFKSPLGFTTITRSGIDKIQAIAKINISYSLKKVSSDNKYVVIKAIGVINSKIDSDGNILNESKRVETYGESSPQNTRNQYPIAMAEKRAMSRCVLKLTGFYELGVYGEDEINEIEKK
tara:strand:+ start:12716 stop:13132 length:417 start_codon:yes stop_codon:yes gene_type:complete